MELVVALALLMIGGIFGLAGYLGFIRLLAKTPVDEITIYQLILMASILCSLAVGFHKLVDVIDLGVPIGSGLCVFFIFLRMCQLEAQNTINHAPSEKDKK